MTFYNQSDHVLILIYIYRPIWHFNELYNENIFPWNFEKSLLMLTFRFIST